MESALTAEERYFLDEYVVPNRRKRFCWELEREHRRADGLWRFAHGARELLKPTRIHSVRVQGGRFVRTDGTSCAKSAIRRCGCCIPRRSGIAQG